MTYQPQHADDVTFPDRLDSHEKVQVDKGMAHRFCHLIKTPEWSIQHGSDRVYMPFDLKYPEKGIEGNLYCLAAKSSN